jgi:hypothetical protein
MKKQLATWKEAKMHNNNRWLTVVLLILIASTLAACGQEAAAPTKIEAVHLEEIGDTDIHRITLTEKAAERLGIETAAVREESVNGAQRTVVPYAAILYDIQGGTWIFTNPEPLVFIREAITVDHIEGDMVVLTEGPAVGTNVVTVGVAELYGADTGVKE